MKIKTSLFNSTTDDLTIVIDLLRASTTIIVALNNFNKVIPVNNNEKAFKIKKMYPNAILAGEKDLKTIEGYDITNSPEKIQEYSGDTFVINTTNGTKVLENIKKRNDNIKVLIGASLNAKALAIKALEIADNEIELIMAGRHQTFNIEDCVGAGLIINEIVNVAHEKNIELEMDESSLAAMILAEDENRAKDLIDNSMASKRLRKLGLNDDIEICKELNTRNIVGLYENNEIIKI
ncbi:MAG: 2-phosphosulfolactate phosphatase [Methanosphaera stadtmanae]|nr:2-phosphosulfolactate phosphatase [Methanosphaera stadtmanae]